MSNSSTRRPLLFRLVLVCEELHKSDWDILCLFSPADIYTLSTRFTVHKEGSQYYSRTEAYRTKHENRKILHKVIHCTHYGIDVQIPEALPCVNNQPTAQAYALKTFPKIYSCPSCTSRLRTQQGPVRLLLLRLQVLNPVIKKRYFTPNGPPGLEGTIFPNAHTANVFTWVMSVIIALLYFVCSCLLFIM